MRILHTSDLHLNSKMNSKLGREKSQERRRELLMNFRKMTEAAKDAGCRAFIIAGDLFDSEKISMSSKKNVLDIISAAKDISFFYLPGNHEKDAITGEELPENLFIFEDDWTYFTLDGLTFAGRRETERGMFQSLRKPSDTDKLICVLHGELADKSDMGGRIGSRELKETKIDYLALGHYHSYSAYEFDKGRFAVYSGTPLGRGFDEIGDLGYVIIDSGNDVNFSFHKTHGRKLLNKEIDITGIASTHELCDKISHACRDISSNNLLRVTLEGGRSPEVKLDLSYAENRFRDSFYYFEIKDSSHLSVSADDYAADKSLKGEFIRLVLLDENLSDKERSDIISMGISALMGENI
jgi:DNA repair exonuclease SbcCD nuclease subunit